MSNLDNVTSDYGAEDYVVLAADTNDIRDIAVKGTCENPDKNINLSILDSLSEHTNVLHTGIPHNIDF